MIDKWQERLVSLINQKKGGMVTIARYREEEIAGHGYSLRVLQNITKGR